MSVETPEFEKVSALDALHGLKDPQALTPGMIQDAINQLVPGADDSASDAESILGFAEFGAEQNPDDEEWAAVRERAEKIFERELAQ